MSSIDNEILLEAEDDAKAVEFIRNYLPNETKERLSDDELYYFLDVLYDYYAESGIFDDTKAEDPDSYIELDLEEIVKYIQKKAKKEGMGEYDPDDLLFVIQGELEYSESLFDE